MPGVRQAGVRGRRDVCMRAFAGGQTAEQPIDRDQAARLLAKGKTDLLKEFISAKSGRPFPAYLVMDEEGKVGFDFPPREAEATTSTAS